MTVSYNFPAAIPHQILKEPPSDIPFEGGMHSFKRQGACVKETITADMLQTVWNELDYRVDVCRITKIAHTEQL